MVTPIFRIVIGNDGPSSTWDVVDLDGAAGTDVVAAIAARGFKPNGRFGHERLREELRAQPCFDGLCGPMWGGEENGRPVIRYETWKAYEHLSA